MLRRTFCSVSTRYELQNPLNVEIQRFLHVRVSSAFWLKPFLATGSNLIRDSKFSSWRTKTIVLHVATSKRHNKFHCSCESFGTKLGEFTFIYAHYVRMPDPTSRARCPNRLRASRSQLIFNFQRASAIWCGVDDTKFAKRLQPPIFGRPNRRGGGTNLTKSLR